MACPNCGTHSAHVSLTQCVDALNDRLRAYEGCLPLDEQRELQVLLRQQGNELEELRDEVARLTGELENALDSWMARALDAERELEDVWKLDEFSRRDRRLYAAHPVVKMNGYWSVYIRPGKDITAGTAAEARRAAVEYLEKEKADG